MKIRPLHATMAYTLIACAGLAHANGVDAASLTRFLDENPGVGTLTSRAERITSVYGPAFSQGLSAEQSVERFFATHVGALGVTANQLKQFWLGEPERAGQPLGVMFNRDTGEYKFSLFTYAQEFEGMPVYGGELRLLVRNEVNFPLVLASSSLRPVGDFAPDRAVMDAPQKELAVAVARAFHRNLIDFTEPALVVWAGDDENAAAPRVALRFIGESADPMAFDYDKIEFVTDAATGEILHREPLVLHADITGTVSGNASQGDGAGICAAPAIDPMPYAQVNVSGGNSAFADVNGNFIVPHGGVTPVTVTVMPRGEWFSVNNQAAATTTLSANVTPPGPVNFVFNSVDAEFARAEVDAYIHSNVVRDFVLSYHPTFPTIGTQTSFPVNVNINNTCNATYNGAAINFYRSGGGCANSAFTSVVYHEYGHHLVNRAGSGQGQYGEGYGDTIGMVIQENPALGIGFQNNCSTGIRSAVNNIQYPCTSAIHFCGQMLSGSVWKLRNELLAVDPSGYYDTLSALTINSVLLHTGNLIAPDITIAFLTLDDDDADITNGTPHYPQIDAAFGAHNMPAPPINALTIDYTTGAPDAINPAGQTVPVTVTPNPGFTTIPGSGVLHVNLGGEGDFDAIPMEFVETVGNVDHYNAQFPASACGQPIQYYVSAEAVGGFVVTNPAGAPDAAYHAISATSVDATFEDDFELNLGWTVVTTASDGAWERGVPVNGNRGDPPADFDGSGQCYVTDNVAGNSDVDNGSTTLTSPVMDASGGEAFISYARWYSNNVGDNPGVDIFVVDISNDGGATWTNLETVGPTGPGTTGGWFFVTHRISDTIAPTDNMRVRFIASDLGPQAVIEAAVDAVSVQIAECATSCPGDTNGDGVVDFVDFSTVLNQYGQTGPGLSGDLNGDEVVDFTDFSIVLGAYGSEC